MSISRRLINLVEDIESGIEPKSNRSGRSSHEDIMDTMEMEVTSTREMPVEPAVDDAMADMSMEPLEPATLDMDVDTELQTETPATVTVSTPKGTSVTVTENHRKPMSHAEALRRRMAEGFFKTTGDIKNFMNGDSLEEVMRKREEAFWMNESEEEEETEEVTIEDTSVEEKDGRRVSGSVTDSTGNEFDIEGLLAFSGDDLQIEDIELGASGSGAEEFEETEESTEEDALKKKSGDDVTFEERYSAKNESSVMKDPIGDVLKLRASSHEHSQVGKPHKDPVKQVQDNALKNNRKLDIAKLRQSLADLKDGKYQTKGESND